VHWAYFDCGKEDEEQFQRQWQDRQRRLLSRLESFGEDPAELELVADRREEAPQWQIQAALHLPARTVVVRAARNDPGETVENIVTGLIEELDRLPAPTTKVTLRREGLESILPILAQCHEKGRSDVFFTWLVPVVASLDEHVQRELRLREIESDLATGQVIPRDVLDDVLLRAYDRFDQRRQDLPLDLWLLRLADEVLEESCQAIATESLDTQVAKPSTEPRGSWRDSWTEWATSSETIEMGDVLPAMPGAETWDTLDLETKKAETDRMLSGLPRQERQALILNTVYGFPPSEVADFQERSEGDVRGDIDAGRHALERYFTEQFLPVLHERQEPSSRRTARRANR